MSVTLFKVGVQKFVVGAGSFVFVSAGWLSLGVAVLNGANFALVETVVDFLQQLLSGITR